MCTETKECIFYASSKGSTTLSPEGVKKLTEAVQPVILFILITEELGKCLAFTWPKSLTVQSSVVSKV